ncbi:MAG: hypothetical protein QXT72_04810 [Candidatus Micrarchaeia archaeon]
MLCRHKKALDYNPKWILVPNDDMYKINDVSVVIEQLESLNNQAIEFVFTK